MRRPVIAQELSGLAVTTDEQAGTGAGEGSHFLVGGEAGRTVSVVGDVPEMQDQRIGDEAEGEGGKHHQRDEIEGDNRTAADAEAHFLEDEPAAEADHEQDDDEEEEKAEQRLPDPKRCGEQCDESP